jgi:hypothetical protein
LSIDIDVWAENTSNSTGKEVALGVQDNIEKTLEYQALTITGCTHISTTRESVAMDFQSGIFTRAVCTYLVSISRTV